MSKIFSPSPASVALSNLHSTIMQIAEDVLVQECLYLPPTLAQSPV